MKTRNEQIDALAKQAIDGLVGYVDLTDVIPTIQGLAVSIKALPEDDRWVRRNEDGVLPEPDVGREVRYAHREFAGQPFIHIDIVWDEKRYWNTGTVAWMYLPEYTDAGE